MGKQWKQCQTLFWGALKSLQMVIAAMKLKDAYSLDARYMGQLPLPQRGLEEERYREDICVLSHKLDRTASSENLPNLFFYSPLNKTFQKHFYT